jgi:hypothetical protein
MQNDARRGGVTDPNEFDVFRQLLERQERHRDYSSRVPIDIATSRARHTALAGTGFSRRRTFAWRAGTPISHPVAKTNGMSRSARASATGNAGLSLNFDVEDPAVEVGARDHVKCSGCGAHWPDHFGSLARKFAGEVHGDDVVILCDQDTFASEMRHICPLRPGLE